MNNFFAVNLHLVKQGTPLFAPLPGAKRTPHLPPRLNKLKTCKGIWDGKSFVIVLFISILVCSSYITFPNLLETKHINQYSRLNCSKEVKLLSFDHSITLTGIKVFYEETMQKPSIDFDCLLDKDVSNIKVLYFSPLFKNLSQGKFCFIA